MKSLYSALSVVLAAMISTASLAGEIVVGIGADDILRDDIPFALSGELRSDPVFGLGPVKLGVGAGAEIDGDSDAWAGVGLVGYIYIPGTGFRIEGSEMVGAYHNGGGNDLGHGLEFRSQIGISYAVTDRVRIGAAFNHKSNAGLSKRNPGVETIFATVGFDF